MRARQVLLGAALSGLGLSVPVAYAGGGPVDASQLQRDLDAIPDPGDDAPSAAPADDPRDAAAPGEAPDPSDTEDPYEPPPAVPSAPPTAVATPSVAPAGVEEPPGQPPAAPGAAPGAAAPVEAVAAPAVPAEAVAAPAVPAEAVTAPPVSEQGPPPSESSAPPPAAAQVAEPFPAVVGDAPEEVRPGRRRARAHRRPATDGQRDEPVMQHQSRPRMLQRRVPSVPLRATRTTRQVRLTADMETTRGVPGHRYARILTGPRAGLYLNRTHNVRRGMAFQLRGRAHIYWTERGRIVVHVPKLR